MHEIRRVIAMLLVGWAADLWPSEGSDDRRVKLAFADLMGTIAVQAKNYLDSKRGRK